jgi:glycerol-3-phosphate dehydrogenase
MESYDLLIIGGGINGTAIAADAAARGLSVLLVEKGDLGSGTSSASSKLIHGGLRYLQYGELGLVREALHDRELLLRRRPHLVRPIELLIPMYAGGPVPAWKLKAGLLLYDRLAGKSRLPRHRRLSREESLRREPDLEPRGLQGGSVYPDAQVVYPERLCLELALEAARHGAVVRTYTTVVGLLRQGCRVVGARLQSDTGAPEVSAPLTINAAGPWVDAVRRLVSESVTPLLGSTRGTHLVLPLLFHGPRSFLYANAKSDGRPFFILPWREMLLVGTTDIPDREDPDAVTAEPREVSYLLAELGLLFPQANVSSEQVLYTYTGLRPLPSSQAPAAKITRRHQIVDHAAEGFPGLWSIVGGKLTTHRSLAEQAVGRALAWLCRGWVRSPTATWRGGDADGWDLSALRRSISAAAADLPLSAAQVEHLVGLYGCTAGEVIERVRQDRSLGEPICLHNPDVAAQVDVAVEREWAVHLADLLLRRTGIGTSPCLGLDCAERAAALMARAAGWDEARRAREVVEYRRLVEQRYRRGLDAREQPVPIR